MKYIIDRRQFDICPRYWWLYYMFNIDFGFKDYFIYCYECNTNICYFLCRTFFFWKQKFKQRYYIKKKKNKQFDIFKKTEVFEYFYTIRINIQNMVFGKLLKIFLFISNVVRTYVLFTILSVSNELQSSTNLIERFISIYIIIRIYLMFNVNYFTFSIYK